MKNLIVILLFLCPSRLFSQIDTSIHFNFYNSQIKLYILGENHFDPDGALQLLWIDHINKSTAISNFIIEYSEEVAGLFNEYVLYNRKKEEVDILCSLVHRNVREKTLLILEYIKKHNDLNENKIKIKGIDTYNYTGFKRNIIGLKTLFPELSNINTLDIQRYFYGKGFRNYNRKNSLKIIRNLIEDFNENEEEYGIRLGAKSGNYRTILHDLEIAYQLNNTLGYAKYDSIREEHLTSKLNEVFDTNRVSVLICGALHALNKKDDDLFFDNTFSPMASRIVEMYPDLVHTTILQHYEKKIYLLFSTLNLLNQPMKYFFESNNRQFLIVNKEDIQHHKIARERCDMIIIKNNEFKEKRK